MTISASARLVAGQLAQARQAELKRTYAERLGQLAASVEPPLSHAELALALELLAPPEGRSGTSEVARFLSTAPRHKNAVPDRVTRAVIDSLLAGDLCLCVETGLVPGARRGALVCLPHEAARLGRDWQRARLAGHTAEPDPEPDLDWDDDALWSGGLVEPTTSPQPTPPAAPLEPSPPAPRRATRGRGRARTERSTLGALAPPAPRTPRHLGGASGPRLGTIGLGCMRLSTEGRPTREDAIAVIHAALDRGVRLFDTADAYALDDDERGHNEALLREAIQTWQGRDALTDDIVVATKGGMRRPGGRWVPDTRPEHLVAACEASLRALRTDAIELYQVHVLDPKRVPVDDVLETLLRLRERGLVRHLGLCNVDAAQLRAIPAGFPLAAVQIALSPFDRKPFASGLIEACRERPDLTVLAYAPLGGHRRRDRAARDAMLASHAARLGVSPQRLALAWLLELDPGIVPLPGATRIESVLDSAPAATLALDDEARAALAARLPAPASAPGAVANTTTESSAGGDGAHVAATGGARRAGEIVLVMGSPAAGKSTAARPLMEAGYQRLNRDELGGTLAGIARRLAEALCETPTQSFVLDNTYATRESRRQILALGREHGVPVRAIVVDATLEDTLVNAAWRMIERYGALLDPQAIRDGGRRDPNLFPPTVLYRHRQLWEPPTVDEGFAEVEVVPFRRALDPARFCHAALLLDLDGTLRTTHSGSPYPLSADDVVLLPGRREVLTQWAARGYRLLGVSNQSGIAAGRVERAQVEAAFARTAELLGLELEVAYCPHPSGAIGCWCRKPMPGLGVWQILRHGLDPARCLVVGDLDSDRALAHNLGVDYVDARQFFGQAEAG